MARTAENIVNIALSRLGITATVTTLSTDTIEQAVQANLIYATTRDALLAEYPWRFARKSAALTEKTTETHIEWEYVYDYPTTCLRVLRLYAEGQEFDDTHEDYEVYSSSVTVEETTSDVKRIGTNVEDAYIDYTAQVTDPDLFSLGFVDCLAWRLAAELAVPLARDFDKRNELYRVYTQTLDAARASDMSEAHRPMRRGSRYMEAR